MTTPALLQAWQKWSCFADSLDLSDGSLDCSALHGRLFRLCGGHPLRASDLQATREGIRAALGPWLSETVSPQASELERLRLAMTACEPAWRALLGMTTRQTDWAEVERVALGAGLAWPEGPFWTSPLYVQNRRRFDLLRALRGRDQAASVALLDALLRVFNHPSGVPLFEWARTMPVLARPTEALRAAALFRDMTSAGALREEWLAPLGWLPLPEKMLRLCQDVCLCLLTRLNEPMPGTDRPARRASAGSRPATRPAPYRRAIPEPLPIEPYFRTITGSEAFLRAIAAEPLEDGHRLVFADWLEEHGDPRAEFLRLELNLPKLPPGNQQSTALRMRMLELHQLLDPDWLALVRRLPLDPLDELRAILPPPRRLLHADGDWVEVETALRMRLPSDYKAFISSYGSGTVGGIEVVSPFGFSKDVRQRWANWAGLLADLREYEAVPYPIFPQSGGLLPFGTLCDIDLLSWRTDGNPEQWPLVYHNREEGFFEIKGLSAVEFVLEAVTQRSPLMILLRRESAFDPPCEFVAHMAEPHAVKFIHPGGIDVDSLTAGLACRWPSEQVRIRRSPFGANLQIESLAGSIYFNTDTGDERILAGITYDLRYASGVEEAVQVLLSTGFVEIGGS